MVLQKKINKIILETMIDFFYTIRYDYETIKNHRFSRFCLRMMERILKSQAYRYTATNHQIEFNMGYDRSFVFPNKQGRTEIHYVQEEVEHYVMNMICNMLKHFLGESIYVWGSNCMCACACPYNNHALSTLNDLIVGHGIKCRLCLYDHSPRCTDYCLTRGGCVDEIIYDESEDDDTYFIDDI